jgi:catechol 2,3-dioxygenase-like lactoylglutathione lyase family enzyme
MAAKAWPMRGARVVAIPLPEACLATADIPLRRARAPNLLQSRSPDATIRARLVARPGRALAQWRLTMTDAALATPDVSAADTIRTTGILHFTIGVRDHIAAAKFYSEVLGCRHMRSNERYSFMQCGGSYFVLAKIPHHVNPNNPGEDAHHHAFMVEAQEFDRAMAIMRARGVALVKYSDEGHHTFPGRHAYFHDADGNCIEIIDLYKK